MINNLQLKTNSVLVALCAGGILSLILGIIYKLWYLWVIGGTFVFLSIFLWLIENQLLDAVFNPKKQARRELIDSCYKLIQDKNYNIYKDFKLTKEYIALKPYFSQPVKEFVDHKPNHFFAMIDGNYDDYIRKIILEDLTKLEKKWRL